MIESQPFDSDPVRCHKSKLPAALIGAGLVALGIAFGSTIGRPSSAWGEVLSSAPPQSFLSGAQISVSVLEDIAATLHQIDGRLSRLETVAKQMANKEEIVLKP